MTTYERYEVLVSGLGFPESLRWRDGALWYADWAAGTASPVRSRSDAAGGGPPSEASRSASTCWPPRTGSGRCSSRPPTRRCCSATGADDEPDAVRRSGRLRRPSVERDRARRRRFGVREQHRLRLRRCGGSVPGRPGRVRRAGPPGRHRAAGGRRAGFPQRDGGGRRRPHAAGRRVVGEPLDRVRDRRRRTLSDRRVWAETPGLHPDGIDATDRTRTGSARSRWPTSALAAASGSPRAARSWTAWTCPSRPSTAWSAISAPDRRSTLRSTTSVVIRPPARPAGYWRSR